MDGVTTAGPRGRARSRSALGRDRPGHGRHRGAGVPASTNRRCCSPPSDRYSRRTLRGASRLLLRQWQGRTSESAARPSASRTATTTTCWSSFEPRTLPCSVPAHRREVLGPAQAHRGPKLRRTQPEIKWQVGATIWGLRLAQDLSRDSQEGTRGRDSPRVATPSEHLRDAAALPAQARPFRLPPRVCTWQCQPSLAWLASPVRTYSGFH